MATWLGHMVISTICTLVGIYWMYCMLYRFCLCCRERASLKRGASARDFQSSFAFPSQMFPKHPLVMWFVAIVLGVDICVEILSAPWGLPMMEYMNLMEHMIMYSTFWCVAVYCIVTYYKPHLLPDGDYMLFIVTLVINMTMAVGHNHEQTMLEKHIHKFMFFNWFVLFLGVLAETIVRNHATVALLRPYGLLLQGTWFAHMAFAIFPEATRWPKEDHAFVALVNFSYGVHMMADVGVIAIVYLLTHLQVNKLSDYEVSKSLDIEYSCYVQRSAIRYHKIMDEDDPLV